MVCGGVLVEGEENSMLVRAFIEFPVVTWDRTSGYSPEKVFFMNAPSNEKWRMQWRDAGDNFGQKMDNSGFGEMLTIKLRCELAE